MINNDKILENMNAKIESLSSVKNQLSFNKMIETQLAQIAAAIPSKSNSGKIPGQSEVSLESVNMISMGLGKPHVTSDTMSPSCIIKKGDPGRPTITCSIAPTPSTTPSATLEQAM